MTSRMATIAAAMCARAPGALEIIAGVERSKGPVDIEERLEPDAGEERVATFTVMSIPTAHLPSLQRHQTVLVGSDDAGWTAYVVRDWERVEDGEIKELILAAKAVPSS